MGIRGLMQVIREHAPEAIGCHPYSDLRGQGYRVAMDGYLNVHQSVAAIRAQGHDLLNDQGQLTSQILGTLRKVVSYVEQGIVPIYVFDGHRHALKQVARDERRQRLVKALDQVEDLVPDTPGWVKAYQASYYVTQPDIDLVIHLLDLMGIPHLTAPLEADPVCVYLTTLRDDEGTRLVKGVCSEDTDMLPLGCQFTFRRMSGHLSDSSQLEIVRLSRILADTGLELDEFRDLCVLLGTDYNRNPRGIGPKRAYAAIQRPGGMETLLDQLDLSDEQRDQIACARDYFRTAVEQVGTDRLYRPLRRQIRQRGLDLRPMDRGGLARWLVEEQGFDLERVVTLLDRYEAAQRASGILV